MRFFSRHLRPPYDGYGSILLKKSDTRQRQLFLEFFREVNVQSETVVVPLRAV
jgi:hypothetical protein